MRVVRIIVTALLVLVGFIVVGAAVQFVQFTLPYLAFHLLGIDDMGAMNAVACGIWLTGAMVIGAGIGAVAWACRRLTFERAGVWIGVIAYPVLCVTMFIVAPSDSWVSAVGYTSAFAAVPISLGVGLLKLLAWAKSRRSAMRGREEPVVTGADCDRKEGMESLRGRPTA